MARIENEPVAPAEAIDLTAAVGAHVEVPPEVLAQSLAEYLRGLLGQGAQRRQRGAPGRHRHRGHLHRLSDPQRPVPRTAEPGQPLLPEHASTWSWRWPRSSCCCSARSTSRWAWSWAWPRSSSASWCSRPCPAAPPPRRSGKCPVSGPGWPWWVAIVVTLLICAGIGAIQGSLVARLRMPALVVTLGGSLILEGVTFIILSTSGLVSITERRFFNELAIYDIFNGRFAPLVGWIALVVVVVAAAAWLWLRELEPASQRPGGPSGGAHRGQDRPHRRRGRRGRRRLQHQPRPRRHHRGRPLHHPHRPGGARSLDPAAAADPLWPLRLRHRRQCRGRPASRGQPAVGPDLVLRPRLGHRRGRRDPLRLLAGGDDQQHHQVRQHLRAAGGGGSGHRRDQPVRWPGEDPPRHPRRAGHRHDLQRAVPALRGRAGGSTSRPPASSWRRRSWTSSRGAAPPAGASPGSDRV